MEADAEAKLVDENARLRELYQQTLEALKKEQESASVTAAAVETRMQELMEEVQTSREEAQSMGAEAEHYRSLFSPLW